MTTEDDFQAQLDARPGDWQTRLVFADWLQERGDSRAEGYRAMGGNDIRSWVYLEEDYIWYASVSYRDDDYSCLSDDWFDLLRGGRLNANNRYREYGTRRAAEDAAAIAFTELPEPRRRELLARGVTA